MGAQKVLSIIFISAIIASGLTAPYASARLEGRWALQAGNIIAGEDFSIQKPQATLFHQQAANMADIEHLDLSFPIFADGLRLGPTATPGSATVDGLALAGGATANILPFGPVNLAFPSIHEDVLQTVNTSSTGFFKANWAYIADTASGNLGSEPLGVHLASGHPLKSPKMLGSEFLWPLMTPLPAALASSGAMMFDLGGLLPNEPIGDALSHVPAYHTPKISFSALGEGTNNANNTTIGINNTAVMGRTAQNANASNASQGPARKPRINPKATKAEITNMSTLQRVYRNAFIGSTMHMAYEGPTQYPAWIDPFNNGMGVFNQIDMQKILQLARQKTLPGEHIAPVLWDL